MAERNENGGTSRNGNDSQIPSASGFRDPNHAGQGSSVGGWPPADVGTSSTPQSGTFAEAEAYRQAPSYHSQPGTPPGYTPHHQQQPMPGQGTGHIGQQDPRFWQGHHFQPQGTGMAWQAAQGTQSPQTPGIVGIETAQPYPPVQRFDRLPQAPAAGERYGSEEFVSSATKAERARQQQPLMPEEPARIKLRHRRFIRVLQLAMSVIFVAALAGAFFAMYSRYQIDRPGPLQQQAMFEVERGQGLSHIAENLEKTGVIRDRKLFAMNVVARKMTKRLKAGRYSIPEQASMQQVLDILIAGKAIFNQITVVEGMTSEQAVELLKVNPLLVGEVTEMPPEGSLMPESYRFSDGMDRNELIAQMRKAQSDFLVEKWTNRQADLPLKTPQEALTLASIVEKETGVPTERRKVAGAFINRLRKGMKLQSDPTIIYGLVGGKGKLGHPLLRSEMAQKTAYNTYQIQGLPPTPIANPGRDAIAAVLNPEQTDAIYFVADGTGGHAFAADLKTHQDNVNRWRQIEAERRRAEQLKEDEEKLRAATSNAPETPETTLKPDPAVTKVDGITTEPLAVPAAGAVGKAEQKVIAGDTANEAIPLPTRKPSLKQSKGPVSLSTPKGGID